MTSTRPVVHVISSLGTGGAEVMLDKLTARLPSDSIRVISLTDVGPIGQRIASRGTPVAGLQLGTGWRGWRALWRLFLMLRKEPPALVQTWLYHGDLVGGLLARAAGVRHVVWNVRNSGAAWGQLSARTRAIVRVNGWLSRWIPDRILCCSETARRNHVMLGYAADKFFVIPNGFDVNRFAPDPAARAALRQELGLSADQAIVGLIARFDEQKNHRGFVAAAQEIHRVRPDVVFVLAGRGTDSSNGALVGWLESAGLRQCVHLLGERSDIARVTAALDVALNTSLGEGFPNAVGEAMACGVPCVVTDVGDSSDIVGPTGRSVPAHDMKALARSVLELLSLPAAERRHLGLAARQRVTERYEIGAVIARYRAFYAELVAAESN